MTHDKKLNRILYALLSRQPKRLADRFDDKRLTFEFLCNVLFKDEGVLTWEMEFLKNRLLSDNYIEFIEVDDVQLPDITQEGIKFLQKGGYVKQNELSDIENKIKTETLKELRRGKIAFVLSVISIAIAFLSFIITFIK